MKEEDVEPLYDGDLKSLESLIEDQMFPDIVVLEEGGKSFKFEYAMEKLSHHPTQFKDIWPEYE